MSDECSLLIPPDVTLLKAVRAALAADPSLQVRETERVHLRESMGSPTDIEAYVFTMPAAAVLVAAMKYLSPVLIEYIKSKYVYIKVGDTQIKVGSAADLAEAKAVAAALAKSQKSKT